MVFLQQPGTNILNQFPVANAGPDQTITENTTITLDGIASKDPDGNITSYFWRQISGPDVNLSDSSDSNPVFTAPNIINDTVLGFRLIVVNNQNASEIPLESTVDECPVKYSPDKYSNNKILSLFYDHNNYTSNSISRTTNQEYNKIE